MKLWRLFPVVAFVGVLAAATVGLAAVQDIEDGHNFAAEGEQDARGCEPMEVEYGQDNGHVDRVKVWYPSGDSHLGPECAGEWVNVEVHSADHTILGSCGPVQMTDQGGSDSNVQCDLSPVIPNEPCTSPNCVSSIDHVNLVVTDLH